MKGRALLFGLNYAGSASELHGCVQDVTNVAAYLARVLAIPTKVCTTPADTTAVAMVRGLYELALQSHSEALTFAYIHYSGHGSSIVDVSGDERDGRDECLVPSDYATAGLLPDDLLERLFRNFNPKTRVVFVCDACHSGTMCDLRFGWDGPVCSVENKACAVAARVLTLSGCLDDQTSADAFNVLGDGKYSGALTSCLLQVLAGKVRAPGAAETAATIAGDAAATRGDVFLMLARLTAALQRGGFPQRPKLGSTYDLTRDRTFL